MARAPASRFLVQIFLLLTTLVIVSSSLCAGTGKSPSTVTFLTEPITLRQNTPSIPVRTHIVYLVETARSAPLNHLEVSSPRYADKWQPYQGNTVHFGNNSEPVWLRFTVHNTAHPATSWLLEVAWTFLDQIDVICFDHESASWCSIHQAGNIFPVTATLPYRHPLFPLQLTANHHNTIYMRVHSSSRMLIPLTLWQHDSLFAGKNKQLLFFGMFFGTMLAMFCYNSSLFFFIRDTSYLFFSCYVLSVLLLSLAFSGIGYQYLWPENCWIKTHAYGFFSSLSFFLATLFVRQFLSLKDYGGWVLWCNNLILAYWGLVLMLYMVPPGSPLLFPSDMVAVLSSVALLCTALYLWRQGNVSARYFTIAWTAFLLGSFLFILALIDVTTYGLVAQYSQMTGFTLEIILLSLALTERINRKEYSREAVRKRASATQRLQTKKLEHRVHRRTRELEQTLASLEEANKELADLSITDALTRIPNRRYFDQAVENEFSRAVRTDEPLSLIMGDLDHFKVINDTHGHRAGDECLKAMAGVLKVPVIRSTDMAARYGGEEFAVILPATNQASAVQVAERIRRAVEELQIVYADRTIPLRLSLGVAGWTPHTGEQVESLIHAADTALYQAKANGRNQVVAAERHTVSENGSTSTEEMPKKREGA